VQASEMLFFPIFLALAYFDVKYRRLPDFIVLPSLGLALLIALVRGCFVPAALGAAFGFVIMLPGVLLNLQGGGDLKASALLGAVMGWLGAFQALFLSLAAIGVFALIMRVLGKRKPEDRIPFGPFLLLGFIGGVL